MSAIIIYVGIALVLMAFIAPVLAQSWRAFFILGSISLVAIAAIWTNYYLVSLAPENFNDVSVVFEQMMLAGLTAVSVALSFITALRLKNWPQTNQMWKARAVRFSIFLASVAVVYVVAGLISGYATHDKWQASWCEQHATSERCQ